MTVKAVAVIQTVDPDNDNAGNFIATIRYASLDAGYYSSHSIYVNDIDPSLSGALVASAIQAAVKADMEYHGVTFGILDSVRLIPATL